MSVRIRSILRLLAAAAMAALLSVSPAVADFPAKPLKIVIPWPAGTAPDSVLRILAEMMREDAGQPVIVTNVVGGSGAKGLATVRNSPADGYTLINNWVAPHVVTPLFNPNVGYQANEDFALVAGFIFLPFTLMVRNDRPIPCRSLSTGPRARTGNSASAPAGSFPYPAWS